LRDVLLRIGIHPADRSDELLPDRWQAAESRSMREGVHARTLTPRRTDGRLLVWLFGFMEGTSILALHRLDGSLDIVVGEVLARYAS